MAWISTENHEPLTQEQALTGAANLFVELCAMMNVDPYLVMDKFFQEAPNNEARDFDSN